MPNEAISRGVIVHVHDKGWMDENGWKIQVEKVWSKCPGGLLKKPALLVLDQFREHITEATKKRFKEEKTQEMGKFLETYNLPRMNDEIETMSRAITTQKSDVIKNL